MSQTRIQYLMAWAVNRWGYVALTLDDKSQAVIKSLDGRCERWLMTGVTTDFPGTPGPLRLVTFDPVSCLTVREYEVPVRQAGAAKALDAVADQQDRDYGALEYCPKCGAHKAFQYSGGRPMKLCSNFTVCSGRAAEHGRAHPLKRLTTVQQQFLLREGRLLTGANLTSTDLNMQRRDGMQQGHLPDSSTNGPTPDAPELPEIGLPLVPDTELVPTHRYKLLKYPFSHFNRVQSTLLANDIHRRDVNLVLGTATSSGKTVCAELCMARTLAKGGKVAYVSPLRALTQEKNDEWSETFGGDYEIGIMTGDYQLTDARADQINRADILCVTSEMLDSRTRKYGSERSAWIDEVRLLVVDESHIIGTERGHAVEAGLMRFTKLNPNARVLFMSATMPNVEEFAKWLSVLNGKTTEIINSPWRPTPLTWHFPRFTETGSYAQNRSAKISEAIALLNDPAKRHEKFLLFVHDKNTGNELLRRVRGEGISAEFHSADAPKEQRNKLEREFKDPAGALRVLVATSTLAWGVNVPAQNVVVVGTTRGIQPVDMADILQMAGRAGRALAPDYYIVAPTAKTYQPTSFDRLSLRLLSSARTLKLNGAKLVELEAGCPSEHAPAAHGRRSRRKLDGVAAGSEGSRRGARRRAGGKARLARTEEQVELDLTPPPSRRRPGAARDRLRRFDAEK